MTAKKPAKQGKRARGRPSRYTHDIAEHICLRLADGESLNAICKGDDMPPESTVRQWVVDDAFGFAAKYARARDMGLDAMADQIIEIANTPQAGVKTKTDDTGKTETTEGDMIEHRRLQVEARKWYLSKLAPKRYGDKLELAGALTVRRDAADMSDAELMAIATSRAANADE